MMEEKQVTANKELESQIEPLYGKATTVKVLAYGSDTVVILCLITRLLPLAIAFLVLALESVR